jgi:ketosteroid isomerase-like protein
MTHSTVQVGTEVPAWAANLYAAIDANDVDGIVANFSEDVQVCFGNSQPVIGRETFRSLAGEPPGGIRGMSHTFRHVWESGDSALLVADVDYTRRDGEVVRVPCATLIHRQPDGLVKHMQVFVDMTPALV